MRNTRSTDILAWTLITLILTNSECLTVARVSAAETPLVHDSRLQLVLIAQQPEIVTPIGIAVDSTDRLFVIESHTHHPPPGYAGPKTDRIKLFSDRGGDGKYGKPTVFAEGLDAAMNLAFSPQGVLHVVCAREVWALHDDDRDGVCEKRKRILELVTEEGYAHNCLLGITFDRDGSIYVARGNTGSRAYSLRGSDGSHVDGYGDGGSIVRCDSGGSHVQEFSTGFWNAINLRFESQGRLLCIDNDPDGRGPNRIVHAVLHGDYGYRSLYGGSGNHPFQGWNGDLPGNLPIASGTGEAPSGMLDCRQSSLPADYGDSLLVTVWNENTIERHAFHEHGVSIQGTRSVLVSGSQSFRPVALDTDTRGNIYFTDWVNVAYPNHGQGRIWKLQTDSEVVRLQPRARFAAYEDSQSQRQLRDDFRTGPSASEQDWVDAIRSRDPFRQHAATVALSRELRSGAPRSLMNHPDADVRLSTLLAAQLADLPQKREILRHFLHDPDLDVRRAAVIWIGTQVLAELRDELDLVIQEPITGPLFAAYLAATECLDPNFITAYRTRSESKSNKLKRRLDEALLRRIASDVERSDVVRALAVRHLRNFADRDNVRLVTELASRSTGVLRLAALRKLPETQLSEARDILLTIASDPAQSSSARAEAAAGLSWFPALDPTEILALLKDEHLPVAVEAARTLRHLTLNAGAIAAATRRWEAAGTNPIEAALHEQLSIVLGRQAAQDRPDSLAEWQLALADGGEPDAGRRIFYSHHATCSKCHTVGEDGGTLGPDLSSISQSVDREKIVRSILRPSDAFPPQYQAWLVITNDGKVHTGLQLDHKSRGAIELFTTDGQVTRFEADEIDQYLASPNSVMPKGLEDNLGVHELRDLVAFLDSLR